ncbi:MAG TPA: hypothetical protein VEI97_09745, partial [bacterium]|nr:hypothetical protein [bacterium]
FFGGSAFQLRTIGLTPGGDVTVEYAISHPFNAPTNLAGPATAGNRADLGVSGRVLFMTPAPAGRVDDESSPLNKDDYEFVFGGSTTIANTKVVKNADGYYNPAGMITLADFPAQNDANAWPFKELVDEGLDSREASSTGTAISNGGSSTGNYAAATGGWQNGNIGANNDGWTGYGVLHQGQTATNTVEFDPDEAAGGIFELDVVVIAKYTDPRGGSTPTQKRANRLPTSDPNNFAYRMPWGAIDIAQVRTDETGPLGTTAGATTTLNIGIVDLDMTATEDASFPSPGANLDQIPTGTGGVSTVTVSAGDLGMTDVAATSAGTGTGTHADDADYTATVTNTPGGTGGVDGGAYVMVNVVDPEDSFTPSGFIVAPLNENSPPGPLTSDLPRVQVFQAEFVTIS